MSKEAVVSILKKVLKKKSISFTDEQLENLIEIPPNSEMGDFAFPCFILSKQLKDSPHQIAIELREDIGSLDKTDFEDIQTNGPYLNFFLNKSVSSQKVISEILKLKEDFGLGSQGKGKKTMVEFPSPNTNKPLHLGHIRNMAIGESVSRILEFQGEKITRANLNNDRGIHICNSMLAYKKWGKKKLPGKKKSDHFVGDFYVMFNKKKTKKLEEEALKMLAKWEAGDKETIKLWKIMNEWALEGFEDTYKKFGIKQDVNFYESQIYKQGKEIVLEGVKKGIFEKTKTGETKVNLEKEGLGEKILLRSDGTAIYIVQDLALAKLKFDKHNIDKSIYVVGNEQEYHFNVLFTILKKLGFAKKEMEHLSYGMVNLPEGRMKSREGTSVDADTFLEDVRKMAEKELKKREKLSKIELEKRSRVIALAAIKYMLLKVDIRKDMIFNPKESIAFEGDTGPYILYSYARASSIVEKTPIAVNFQTPKLEEKEFELIKKLSQFPEIVENARKNLNPTLVANYSYQLAQVFNEFYHTCKVIGSKEEDFRLSLVESFRIVLKNSLSLLGIETIEKM